jgi:hypothetical protein
MNQIFQAKNKIQDQFAPTGPWRVNSTEVE